MVNFRGFSRMGCLLAGLGLLTGSLVFPAAQAAGDRVSKTTEAVMSPDEAAVLKKLRTKFPKANFYDQVSRVAPDIYEIWVNDQQAYTNEDVHGIFVGGELLDPETMSNLTKKRYDDRLAKAWENLPMQDALVTVYGNGKAKIAMFTDPDCVFCEKQEKDVFEANKSTLNLTVYRFQFPIRQLHPTAEVDAVSVACAADPVKTLLDFQVFGKAIPTMSCENGIKSEAVTHHYGAMLGFNGTPTFVFPNNHFAVGTLDINTLHDLLKKSGQE